MGERQQIGDHSRLQPFIEIMDSTLRDGEQTNGVSFLPHEKLVIARMLLKDLNVDRIEVASARISDGEKEAVKMICRYARQIGKLDSVEVLGEYDLAFVGCNLAQNSRRAYRRHNQMHRLCNKSRF